MRVLYFHQHFATPRGSGGTRSYEVARRLVACGHAVTMVCGRNDRAGALLDGPFAGGMRRGAVDGIDLVELDIPYSNSDKFIRRTLQFLKYSWRSIMLAMREDYDLAFATTTPLTAGMPGIAARWVRGKPFVFEVRDLWPELPRAMGVIRNPVVLWAMGLLEWSSYWSAHHVIGLSPGIVDGIARRGVPRRRITLIPNGSDLALFGRDRGGWRPPGIAPATLLAVFAGAHGTANGLGAVLDAAGELKRRGRRDITMLLIGRGKLKPSLELRATEERLDQVVFLDAVPKDQLSRLFAATDVGLQILADVPAFYYGTSPNKFFDYIAAGLPVLINYPGWLAGMVVAERCGFAVPPNDSAAFADALEEAADDRHGLREMGQRARLLAERDFDRTRLSEQFVACLTSVCADRSATPRTPRARPAL